MMKNCGKIGRKRGEMVEDFEKMVKNGIKMMKNG